MAGARSRQGSQRTRIPFFNMNRIAHDVRMILVEEGNGIIEELARRIAEEAKRRAPRLNVGASGPARGPNKRPPGKGDGKEGPLADKIFVTPSIKVPSSWVVCAPTWYSHFVEYGTTPHEMPRADYQEEVKQGLRKKMRFRAADGRWVTADWVYHPGATARPFLRPAADMAEQLLDQIVQSRHP